MQRVERLKFIKEALRTLEREGVTASKYGDFSHGMAFSVGLRQDPEKGPYDEKLDRLLEPYLGRSLTILEVQLTGFDSSFERQGCTLFFVVVTVEGHLAIVAERDFSTVAGQRWFEKLRSLDCLWGQFQRLNRLTETAYVLRFPPSRLAEWSLFCAVMVRLAEWFDLVADFEAACLNPKAPETSIMQCVFPFLHAQPPVPQPEVAPINEEPT